MNKIGGIGSKSNNETGAVLSFVKYFLDNFRNDGLVLHVSTLQDAIKHCIDSKKVLILYFHNKNISFSKHFCSVIQELIDDDKFFFLGWNVEEKKHHQALISALNFYHEFSHLIDLIEMKKCTALIVVPFEKSITCFSRVRGEICKRTLQHTLKEARHFCRVESWVAGPVSPLESSQGLVISKNLHQSYGNMQMKRIEIILRMLLELEAEPDMPDQRRIIDIVINNTKSLVISICNYTVEILNAVIPKHAEYFALLQNIRSNFENVISEVGKLVWNYKVGTHCVTVYLEFARKVVLILNILSEGYNFVVNPEENSLKMFLKNVSSWLDRTANFMKKSNRTLTIQN